jgi:hypothetical protein
MPVPCLGFPYEMQQAPVGPMGHGLRPLHELLAPPNCPLIAAQSFRVICTHTGIPDAVTTQHAPGCDCASHREAMKPTIKAMTHPDHARLAGVCIMRLQGSAAHAHPTSRVADPQADSS